MIASPSFIFWTNLENLKALILAIRCILHSMKFAFDASLNSIRCILHSMDFAFDEIRFRWLQSVPIWESMHSIGTFFSPIFHSVLEGDLYASLRFEKFKSDEIESSAVTCKVNFHNKTGQKASGIC